MWEIIGHDWAVKLLQHSLAQNHIAHAYLLIGPSQIGKTKLGLTLAQALNCTNAAPPCGECLSCTKISRGIHPDVRLIEPENGTLKIDQVRQVQKETALAPYEGKWRVYIFADFQLATEEAANCLLKTLEEPPPQVVLILTATDAGALLPTIVSRCQTFYLRPLAIEEAAAALRAECQIPGDRAQLLARLAEGRLGWAITACKEQAALQSREAHLAKLDGIPQQDLIARLQVAQQLAGLADLPDILDLWTSWWRDILLLQAGCQDLLTNIDHQQALETEATKYSVHQVQSFLRAIQTTKAELMGNANSRLAMEVLLMDCPSWGGQGAISS